MALGDQTYFDRYTVETVGFCFVRRTLLRVIGYGGHHGKWGDDMREKEEGFYTQCPPESGYKRVGNPLWARRFERDKRSRDRTSEPWRPQ